ncbi:MAG: SGNH/GDSL hydrolase family protein [Actinomycetota bacterium]
MNGALRLVVIGDSTAFTDDVGPQLPSHKTLYPNVLAAELERALRRPVELSVLARAGMDTREAWKLVTKDRHAQFEVLMGADAVVVGIGSIDHAPTGMPPFIEAMIPYLQSPWLRRFARGLTRQIHTRVVVLTRARLSHESAVGFARFYDGVLFMVRSLAHGAAGVALGPTSHTSSYYGSTHPHRRAREALQRDIATRNGFPFVPSWALVEPFGDRLNPDGIHWPPEAHQAVGEALARALLDQLIGDRPRPPLPRAGEKTAAGS